MDSPLKYDQAVAKEFGVTKAHDLEPEVKLMFARNQLDEIQKFLWRERIDLILAENQSNGDVEALAADAKTKVASHRTNIKGIVSSITVLGKLVDELQAATK